MLAMYLVNIGNELIRQDLQENRVQEEFIVRIQGKRGSTTTNGSGYCYPHLLIRHCNSDIFDLQVVACYF